MENRRMKILVSLGIVIIATIIPIKWYLSTSMSNEAPLIAASRNGDISRVRFLLESGEDVNQRGESGGTPLFYAVGNDHIEIADELLSKGASIEAIDDEERTALFANLSNERDSIEMLRFLVNKRASVGHLDKHGMNPLFLAVDIGGSPEKTRFLLEQGVNPNVKSKTDEDFPLLIATSWQSQSIVTLLLDYGADPNLQQRDGKSALMEACQQNNKDIVALLLSKGADASLKNRRGLTALEFVSKDAIEIRDLLERRVR
jgi:ankyrin repeat protein